MQKSHFHRNWSFIDFELHFGGYLVGQSHTKVDMWLILGVQAGKVGLTAGRQAGCWLPGWPQGPQELRGHGQRRGTPLSGGYGNYQTQVAKIPNYQYTKVQRYQGENLRSYQGYHVTNLPLMPRSLVAPGGPADIYMGIRI